MATEQYTGGGAGHCGVGVGGKHFVAEGVGVGVGDAQGFVPPEVGVILGVGVGVGVFVGVTLLVGVIVGVTELVGVTVLVGVTEFVGVFVGVSVFVGVTVGVTVLVGVGVGLKLKQSSPISHVLLYVISNPSGKLNMKPQKVIVSPGLIKFAIDAAPPQSCLEYIITPKVLLYNVIHLQY
jgi:hypothetical protein